jgi:hypothetical protein
MTDKEGTKPPDFRHTWTNLPETKCAHDTLEPNGHLPPKYQPMRCAECKTPFSSAEVERLRVIDPILNKLDDDGETH